MKRTQRHCLPAPELPLDLVREIAHHCHFKSARDIVIFSLVSRDFQAAVPLLLLHWYRYVRKESEPVLFGVENRPEIWAMKTTGDRSCLRHASLFRAAFSATAETPERRCAAFEFQKFALQESYWFTAYVGAREELVRHFSTTEHAKLAASRIFYYDPRQKTVTPLPQVTGVKTHTETRHRMVQYIHSRFVKRVGEDSVLSKYVHEWYYQKEGAMVNKNPCADYYGLRKEEDPDYACEFGAATGGEAVGTLLRDGLHVLTSEEPVMCEFRANLYYCLAKPPHCTTEFAVQQYATSQERLAPLLPRLGLTGEPDTHTESDEDSLFDDFLGQDVTDWFRTRFSK